MHVYIYILDDNTKDEDGWISISTLLYTMMIIVTTAFQIEMRSMLCQK